MIENKVNKLSENKIIEIEIKILKHIVKIDANKIFIKNVVNYLEDLEADCGPTVVQNFTLTKI